MLRINVALNQQYRNEKSKWTEIIPSQKTLVIKRISMMDVCRYGAWMLQRDNAHYLCTERKDWET